MAEARANPTVSAKPHPRRRWFNYTLQAFWVVALIFIVQLYYFSIAPGYADLMKVCSEPNCVESQLNTEGLASLQRLGIPLPAFALYQLTLIYFIVIIYTVISALIFRARRNDNIALYSAIVLLLFGAFVSDFVVVLGEVEPQFTTLIDLAPGLTVIAFAILCYVFPDGRFVPRWTRWAMWGWIGAPIFMVVVTLLGVDALFSGAMTVFLLLLLATCVIAPIQRYRKLSSRSQRQQLKWVLFGLAQLLGTLLIIVELLPRAFPTLDITGTLPNIISNMLQVISIALFPITIAIALLRHRLWNVDLVINRTLVYLPLTSIVTVFYTTSLAVGQRYFTDATGSQSLAFTVFIAFLLTATVTPIKNWLQAYVDGHFKEAQGNLSELKELDRQLSQVVLAFDNTSLARRLVETIVEANNAKGAALYQYEDETMVLAYRTPNWTWTEGEVSILLSDSDDIYGRLLLGQRNDRDDYTMDEIEEIRKRTLPIVRNIRALTAIQGEMRIEGPVEAGTGAAEAPLQLMGVGERASHEIESALDTQNEPG